uniref:Uncharacterized protein n=1 Tax=Pyrodinium bahamense TaxID=73915 RepID=A0A7S0FIH2_9DINO
MPGLTVSRALNVTALAVTSLRVLASANAKDACACLNWKEVYKKDMAMCGEGLEFHIADPSRLGYARREVVNAFAFAGPNFDACQRFFKKLDSDRCANVGPYPKDTTDWHGMTWCYVPKECDDLYGGKRLSENSNGWMDWLASFVNDPRLAKVSEISWRLCRPGKDKQLRDMDVEDLLDLCERQSLSMRFCLKSAYPSEWAFLWPPIHEAWVKRADAYFYQQLPEQLRDAMTKREPIVVDTQWGGFESDLVVIRGNDAFLLQWNPGECGATQYCRKQLEAPIDLHGAQGAPRTEL